MTAISGNIIVLLMICILIRIFFTSKFIESEIWQATVTPLASIIGSGFLISSAFVVLITGKWAALVMLVIVTVAYLLGNVIRFNIFYFEPYLLNKETPSLLTRLENISEPILGIAYVISVAFYLKLFAIFALQELITKNYIYENFLTTSILIIIGCFGWFKGLHILEKMEKYVVNAKLIVILAMIIGYLFYNINIYFKGNWYIAEHIHDTSFEAIKKLLGMLIIVQGFETSRYLGQIYSAKIRIQTMRYAQIISGAIYVAFVSSAMVLFNNIYSIDETAIIELSRLVAPILPLFLIFAATMSQISAAIADSIGSSGLISDATNKSISIRQGIILTVTTAILLIWLTNIYEIIVIASKAFAIYYAIQCVIAIILAYNIKSIFKAYVFISLFILMILVIFFGTPVG